jgi:cyclic pyranopterin phosphate synthase
MNQLSHTDPQGKARMVDVGNKPDQKRIARATGFICLQPETIALVKENKLMKGDVLSVARIAGIQAAKQTSALVPLCHPLAINFAGIEEEITDEGIQITSEVHTIGKTGVEMEALTAVSLALLTIYDMCKAVDKQMIIQNIHLLEKSKSDVI